MRITINQEPIALLKGYKFDIHVDGKKKYEAQGIFTEGLIVKGLDGNELFRLVVQFNWFKPKVHVKFMGGTIAYYSTISLWKKHYRLDFENDRYDIYGHSKRRASIYRNDVQIAWYQKDAVAVLSGDNYHATCDDGINEHVIIALMLIRDMTKPAKNKSTVNIDGGSLGPFKKKFDPNWQPKQQIENQ